MLLSWTEAEIHSRRMGVGRGGAFIFLLSFPTRPLQQFPCNIIRCGIVSVDFQESSSHVTTSRENGGTLLGMAACVNESVYQTMFSSLHLQNYWWGCV